MLLPQALLSPLGGTLADRHSRRFLMITADAISATCMLLLIALIFSSRIELWHVYTMMSIRSAMAAFQQPAAAASTAMLVPVSFLPRVAGLSQMLQGLVTITAAPLGALAISTMSIGLALSVDVLTALLGIIPLLLFEIPQPSSQPRKPSLWTEFQKGVHLVSSDAGLWRLYGLLSAVMLVIMPTGMLVPLLVREYFSGGANQVALMPLLSAVATIIGGLLIGAFPPKRRMPWLLWGLATSCFSVTLTALAPEDNFRLALLWWALSGMTFAIGSGPLTTLLQLTIPNHLQGRAFSLLGTVMGLAAPVGLAIATPLGELIGVRWLFVVLGVLGGCVSLAGFLSPALLRLDAHDVSNETKAN